MIECDSAGVRTQDPLRIGRGPYTKKKASSKNEDACLLSDSAGARTQDPLRFGRGIYTKKRSLMRTLLIIC